MILICGQDIGRTRAYTALVCLVVKDNKLYVKDVIQWPHINSTIYESETIQYCQDNQITKILVDASGLATSHEKYEQAGLYAEGIKFTDQWKHDAFTLYNGLLSGEILHIHPKFTELTRQMKLQLLKPGMGHTPKYTEPSGDFDDQLWALILACWGAVEYMDNPSEIMVASKKPKYGHRDEEWGSAIPDKFWMTSQGRETYYPS